jgi:hypothetical protein
MSTTYCIMPLNEECAAWLDSEGLSHPPVSPRFRDPTATEITDVLRALPDYEYEIWCNPHHKTWDAHVAWAADPSHGPHTTICLLDYCGDDTPHRFYFSGGWREVIFLVIERLSRVCGPLAVADGGCGIPYLVQPGMAADIMIREYEARSSNRPAGAKP